MLLNDIIEQAFQGGPQGPEAAYEELGAQFFEVISQKIGEAVLKCGDKVPVVAGTWLIDAKARVSTNK